jgi:predicted AlkP superfamily phosphohydrolase/phosphomutase
MLTNAAAAGAVAAGYVAALVLHLNPALRLDDPGAWLLVGAVLVAYGVHLAAAFYVAIVVRELLWTDGVSPGWLSYRVLSWFWGVSAAVAVFLIWHNLQAFASALDGEAADRFFQASVALTAFASLAILLAVVSPARPPARRWLAWAFGGVVLASLVVPVALRGMGRSPAADHATRVDVRQTPRAAAGRRAVLLGIDGASLDVIARAVADGRLPNFGRLLDQGASMHLATLRPTQPGPVWTAIATGKLPWRNGVRSAATYQGFLGGRHADLLPDFCFAHALVSFGLLRETIQTSAALEASPLWTLLGHGGLSSTIVRWPMTFPAAPMSGTVVTDEYHRASAFRLALAEPGLTYPTALAGELAGLAPPQAAMSRADAPEADPGGTPLALDRLYMSVADAVTAQNPTDLVAVRLEGLDTVGHYYLRYAMPQEFGDVSEDERARYGRVMDRYYEYLDTEVGRLLAGLGPDDLLLVVSPFGLEPLSVPKRLLERAMGNAAMTGTHERAPDGFLLAFGSAVRAGRSPRGSVVDLAPTLLYFYSLPLGRDMDGFARADIFTPAFSAERPIAYIPTYER